MMKRFQTLLSISTGAASQRWREIAKSESRPGLEFGTAVTKVGRCMLTVSIPVLGNGGIFALFWSKLGLGHRYIDFRVPVHPCQGHDNRGVIALFQGFSKSRVSFFIRDIPTVNRDVFVFLAEHFPAETGAPVFFFCWDVPPNDADAPLLETSLCSGTSLFRLLLIFFLFFGPGNK